MRQLAVLAISATVLSGVASAQTPLPPPAPSSTAPQSSSGQRTDRYVEGVGGWTFGDKGSEFFGAEGGFTLRRQVFVFVEGGRVNNAAGQSFRTAAQIVAEGLAKTQPGVTVVATQPTIFFDAGVRFHATVKGSRAQPFLLAGAGVARVKQDARFTSGGNDITSSMAQFGVVLGTDLSGSFTKMQIALGGGLMIPVQQRMFGELSYRFVRIFAEDGGINVNRAGLGFGIRF